MLVVALADARAELDEILVGVDDRPLHGLGGATDALVTVDRPTTTKTRLVARSQQLLRFDEEEDADLAAVDVDRVVATLTDALATADAVILEDYNKGVLVPVVIEKTIALARALI